MQIATFFWLIAWTWLISRSFSLISWLFLGLLLNLGDQVGSRRRARGAERRPEWGAKRRTEAGAEARGPGAVPEGIFKSPMGEGILGKITAKKYEFCTYFFSLLRSVLVSLSPILALLTRLRLLLLPRLPFPFPCCLDILIFQRVSNCFLLQKIDKNMKLQNITTMNKILERVPIIIKVMITLHSCPFKGCYLL